MIRRVTRRTLARGLVAALPAAGAQQPSSPDEELKAARERIAANSKQLAAQSVPMTVEPSFQFKA